MMHKCCKKTSARTALTSCSQSYISETFQNSFVVGWAITKTNHRPSSLSVLRNLKLAQSHVALSCAPHKNQVTMLHGYGIILT